MFDLLYRDELAMLREAGGALAARHPELASRLAAPSDDPDVERLVQSFAFVAARLRQRIDAAVPDLMEALLGMVLPGALDPIPAATIVAFTQARPRRGVQRVARGTPLQAREVAGTRCTFITTRELVLLPIALTAARLDREDGREPTITLRFEADGDGDWARAGHAVRLHLHGDAALSDQLALWLARHLRSVRVRAADGRECTLTGAAPVRPIELDDDDALLPWPTLTPASMRLLEESFTLPAQHRFFDLSGLGAAADLLSDAFEVVLRFERPPPLPARLPDDLVRLHCVPAVNLFEVDAEPLRVDLRERPLLLRAAGLDPTHAEVFGVRAVTGVRAGGKRVAYPAATALGAASNGAGRYALTRRPSPVDAGIHTYLTLHRTLDGAREAPEETLAIALTCTNRDLPRALGVGDVATPTARTPANVTFSNITAVSAPRRPALGSAGMGKLVTWLACSRRGMSDAETLRAWLTLHAGRGGPADDPRIEAVQRVTTSTRTRMCAGAPVRGSHYHVTLDGGGFASEGEAYAFGALLHRMLAVDARLNAFADLTVTVAPSGTRFDYAEELR